MTRCHICAADCDLTAEYRALWPVHITRERVSPECGTIVTICEDCRHALGGIEECACCHTLVHESLLTYWGDERYCGAEACEDYFRELVESAAEPKWGAFE